MLWSLSVQAIGAGDASLTLDRNMIQLEAISDAGDVLLDLKQGTRLLGSNGLFGEKHKRGNFNTRRHGDGIKLACRRVVLSRRDHGFSLIELVITMTVMAILSLGVVPLVKMSVKRQKRATAARIAATNARGH